jgi:hypothetical protein
MNSYNKTDLTLSRYNQLLSYDNHITQYQFKKNYIFECLLTVGDRYFILHDEVFDLQENNKLGNIWSSIDVFKTIFKNTKLDNQEYIQIQESWSRLPVLENNGTLYGLRDFLLEWNFFDDTWLGKGLKKTGESLSDFAASSWDGLKKLGVAINKGEWSEILDLLKRGTLFILRKLKDAAYSTLGMVVDAILVATGIGKGAQMVVWGLITALDIYQITKNDWPEDDDRDELSKYMDLGSDLLGLVFTGVAAKGARAIFKPLSGLSTKNMALKVSQNAKLKSTIQTIYTAIKSGRGKLKTVENTISKKWPSGAKFINNVLSSFDSVMKKLQTYLGKIMSKSNLKGITKNYKPTPGRGFVTPAKSGKEFFKRSLKPGGVSAGLLYGITKVEDFLNKKAQNQIYNGLMPDLEDIEIAKLAKKVEDMDPADYATIDQIFLNYDEIYNVADDEVKLNKLRKIQRGVLEAYLENPNVDLFAIASQLAK